MISGATYELNGTEFDVDRSIFDNSGTITGHFDKKGLIKKMLEEDPELLQEVITELRTEKINNIKTNK